MEKILLFLIKIADFDEKKHFPKIILKSCMLFKRQEISQPTKTEIQQ